MSDMSEWDWNYEKMLDDNANRKKAEFEASIEPEKEPFAYCEECDKPIDEKGGDWYYSKKYDVYVCGHCLDCGYGEKGRR